MDLSAKQKDHVFRRRAFDKRERAVFADELAAVGGKPGVLLLGETIERRDGT